MFMAANKATHRPMQKWRKACGKIEAPVARLAFNLAAHKAAAVD
jgi:hypothetical protein